MQWVRNILDGKAEQDRVLYDDTDSEAGFVLVPDMKWDGKDLDSLYLLAIARKEGLLSLRELREEHIPLLRNILVKGKVCWLACDNAVSVHRVFNTTC